MEYKTINIRRANDPAEEIICTTFGMTSDHTKHYDWADFRDQLVKNEKLDSFRLDGDFKQAVYLASNTVDYLLKIEAEAKEREKPITLRQCIYPRLLKVRTRIKKPCKNFWNA